MNAQNCDMKTKYYKVSIPIDDEVQRKLREIIDEDNTTIGKWFRKMILNEITRREQVENGHTQIDLDELRRRSVQGIEAAR